ncbi:RecE-like exonuclease [Microbacterium phage Phonegingi]|nr:RecE-like exonuclease [Microbacterium phage Phonegingi]
MTSLLTARRPVEGPAYDKTKPETRGPWLAFRRAGITATEIRDWGNGSKRREIIEAKRTGEFVDLSHNIYVNHGNVREPVIAAWIEARFGIAPCDSVFASADNSRHLASPDGITLDPFTRELVVGTSDATLAEIKTSKHDLTPGRLDAERALITIEPGSKFDLSGYYTQMQWQMYVMNAVRTLFVYEQHDGKIDPETGTFTPKGVPEYAWIPRDDALIDRLVTERAPVALAEIDRALSGGGMPPVGPLPAEHAILVADLLKARDDEAIAKAAKEAAWAKLQALYLSTDEQPKPDVSIDVPDFAKISVSTSTKDVRKVDLDAARAKAPALVSKYEALIARHTKIEPETTQRLTVTAPKKDKEIAS